MLYTAFQVLPNINWFQVLPNINWFQSFPNINWFQSFGFGCQIYTSTKMFSQVIIIFTVLSILNAAVIHLADNQTLTRSKRQFDTVNWVIAVGNNVRGCVQGPPGRYYGCHNGYCWAYCGASLTANDWCYTSNTAGTWTNMNKYVSCQRDDQCDPCWKCKGTCAMI